MHKTILTGLVLTAVVMAGGCSGEEQDTAPETRITATAEPPTVAASQQAPSSVKEESMSVAESTPTDEIAVDAAVPDTLAFTATTLENDAFDGAQLAGTPTVLWFWAPWCPTCRAQVDGVESIASKYEGRLNVVGVGGLSDAADIRDFAQGVDGPIHLVDEEGSVWRHFGITAQSVYVMLDAQGLVVKDGYLDNGALEQAVAELVG